MSDVYRFEDSNERSWAMFAHLSGLAGYIIPFGGAVVPLIVMIAKKDMAIVSAIARQALFLNIFAFLSAFVVFVLFLTILLIPVAILLSIVVGISVVALPIFGAMKAADGVYFRYPIVGVDPREL